MRTLSIAFIAACIASALIALLPCSAHGENVDGTARAVKPRLIVLTDIGNEPDDQMSMVRLMLYSNEIDIEGLVATTSTWLRDSVNPQTIRQIVEAYGQVRPNLLRHCGGWPDSGDLLKRISVGQAHYGMQSVRADGMSAGAQAIVDAAARPDARPLWIAVWGGANTLAQALIEIRASRSPAEAQRLIAKLRVYSISDQDDAGRWIRAEFPDLFYIVSPSSQDGRDYASRRRQAELRMVLLP